ncbi:MFS transporter [Mycoplasma feriruminatoris]|uniref:hexose phosphate transporter n=1 Tax=Mycoplasma feriruminatoris TaxID=1179777 RepID=UPI00241D42AD|nr:hexose phosphate transporter [Mycoplasma feriruminatoris]WFQ96360.1 MFS transporter [Mycoplasma feriruminatoris]
MKSVEKWSQNHRMLYGSILWAFIGFGYLLFIANWAFAIGLAGGGIKGGEATPGFLGYFQIENNASFQLTNTAANWAITFGRGIGSVVVAFLLVKFAHKKATLIACVMTLFGLPAAFMPAANYGYVLFLILRTVMAIGGTMLTILFQPVAANFFTKKAKPIYSQIAIAFFPLGSIISLVPFVIAGDSASVEALQNNWKTVFIVMSLLYLIPLFAVLFLGTNFDVKKDSNEPKVNGFKILKGYLKTKATYAWLLVFGGWLVVAVFPISVSLALFPWISGLEGNTLANEIRIWQILFLFAGTVGPVIVGLWSRFNLKRRWYIVVLISLGILLFVLSIIVYKFGLATNYNKDSKSLMGNYKGWLALFYVLGFLSGFCTWGIEAVILNLPHEYKEADHKTIGWMFSLIWGFGYMFFTLSLIIVTSVPLIGSITKPTQAIIQLVLIVIFGLMSFVGILMLKEPRDDAKTFPDFKAKKQQVK